MTLIPSPPQMGRLWGAAPTQLIEFVDSYVNVEGSGSRITSFDGIRPSDIQENDVMIASLHLSNHTDTGPSLDNPGPSGFTFITNSNHSAIGNNYFHNSLWYKVATGSEPLTYNWTWGNDMYATICIMTFRYVDAADVVDDTDTSTSTTGTLNLGSVTTSGINRMGVMALTVRSVDADQSTISTVPTDFIIAETARDATPSNDRGKYRYLCGYKLFTEAGATGTQTFTFGDIGPGTIQRCGSILTALNPEDE